MDKKNNQFHRKALMIATVPSMIGQFNMANIDILQSIGYEVHVACNFDDRSVWTEERVDEFIEQLNSLEIKRYQIDFARSPKHVGKIAKSYKQIKQLLFHEKYALVHVHTPVAAAEVRLAAKDYNDAIDRRIKEGKPMPGRLKVIYTAHGFHFYDGAPKKNWILYYPIEKYVSKYTDVLITINKEDYKRAISHFHEKRTFYVPGVGVDVKKFSDVCIDRNKRRKELGVSPEDFLLISVGELSVRKNQIVVLKALAEIKRKNPEISAQFKYILVGQGKLEEEYKKFIQSHSLEKTVTLLGFRTDIPELLKASDLFVFPSLQEGLPMALMEAMASGLPIVCSRIRGNVDLIEDGENGYLCDPGSDEEFTVKILTIYENNQKNHKILADMGHVNLNRIKNFNIKTINTKMTKIYKEIQG